MKRYTDADALYEKAKELETQALDYVLKLNEIPFEEMGEKEKFEWVKWSVILAERTAFKFAVVDAPVADVQEVKHGKWVDRKINAINPEWVQEKCSVCRGFAYKNESARSYDYCPNCGADMRERNNNE